MQGVSLSATDQGVQALGDGASVAVLKVVAPNDLVRPKFAKAYLDLATMQSSDVKKISNYMSTVLLKFMYCLGY